MKINQLSESDYNDIVDEITRLLKKRKKAAKMVDVQKKLLTDYAEKIKMLKCENDRRTLQLSEMRNIIEDKGLEIDNLIARLANEQETVAEWDGQLKNMDGQISAYENVISNFVATRGKR